MNNSKSKQWVVCHANVFAAPELYQPVEVCVREIGGELRYGNCASPIETASFAQSADIFLTNAIDWPPDLPGSLKRLKLIVTYGSGYDKIPVSAATEAGIVVAYTPLYGVEEVADQALGLLLMCGRRLSQLERQVRLGAWGGRISFAQPLRRLSSATLGIMGLGHIGTAMCARAQALGMNVIAWDPWLTPEQARERGAPLVEVESLLSESDFISLHLRLSEKTHHLLGREEFRLMKPSAYLINTARGGLVNETALLEALQQGQIAGAALDTIDPEPPKPDNPLLHMPEVIVTGHYASVSVEANRDRHYQVAETIKRFSEGYWPLFVANPSVVPKIPLIHP